MDQNEKILTYFAYAHLPAHLQTVSEAFHRIAHDTVMVLPAGAERSACLRKLLEAKDCAVRAALDIARPLSSRPPPPEEQTR